MTDRQKQSLKMEYELLKVRRNRIVNTWPFPIQVVGNITKYCAKETKKYKCFPCIRKYPLDNIPDLSIYKNYGDQIQDVMEIEQKMERIQKANLLLFLDE